jgi:hypothetical protein
VGGSPSAWRSSAPWQPLLGSPCSHAAGARSTRRSWRRCSLAASLTVFFAFTYPANQQTANGTLLPEHWERLRRQWEYSHAAGAVLDLTALVSFTLSLLVQRR